MSILNDERIITESKFRDLISPFSKELVSTDQSGDLSRKISYGTSSFGYDVRLSPNEFFVTRQLFGTTKSVDPKDFIPFDFFERVELFRDHGDSYFIIPPYSFGLGVTVEKIKMPDYAIAIVLNKSTYARCGLNCTTTVLEPEWEGHITLEFANNNPFGIKLYANEGIAQLVFLDGEECNTTYRDRSGKYQNQPQRVVFPKM